MYLIRSRGNFFSCFLRRVQRRINKSILRSVILKGRHGEGEHRFPQQWNGHLPTQKNPEFRTGDVQGWGSPSACTKHSTSCKFMTPYYSFHLISSLTFL